MEFLSLYISYIYKFFALFYYYIIHIRAFSPLTIKPITASAVRRDVVVHFYIVF